MPIHDWTRVGPGIYHDFHQGWTIDLKRALNHGLLPDGYYAVVEYRGTDSGRAELDDRAAYARKANRFLSHNPSDRAVAVLEVVSPGHKDSVEQFDNYLGTLAGFLSAGLHLLLIDVFPPSLRNPDGVDRAIWACLTGESPPPPAGKPLTAAAFSADPLSLYSEPFGVGDPLPDAPLFLGRDWYITVPLEASYGSAWSGVAGYTRRMFDLPPESG
jgi:hypothetical protein